jgi:hypothetical protein
MQSTPMYPLVCFHDTDATPASLAKFQARLEPCHTVAQSTVPECDNLYVTSQTIQVAGDGKKCGFALQLFFAVPNF